jgi:hypothetical protein
MRGTLSRVPSWDRRDGGQRCVCARVRAERRPARGAERSWSGGALRVGAVAFPGGSGTLNDRRFVVPKSQPFSTNGIYSVSEFSAKWGELRTRSVTVLYRTPMLTVWVSDSLSFFSLLNAHNFSSASLVPVLSYKRRVRLSVDVVSLAVYLVVFRCSVT